MSRVDRGASTTYNNVLEDIGIKNSFKYMHFSQSLVIRIPERALGELVVTSPVNIEKKNEKNCHQPNELWVNLLRWW